MNPGEQNGYWQPQDQSGVPNSSTAPAKAPAQPTAPNTMDDQILVEWQASEYLHQEKDGLWFLGAAGVLIVLLGLAIWFKQWTFVGLLVVMAVAVVVYSRRPPRVLHYGLSSSGLQVGEKHYDYNQFKAFGVRQEGGVYSVVLLPLQRFAPATSLYFDPAQGEKIVDTLGARLPMQPVEPDWMDGIIRRLRL